MFELKWDPKLGIWADTDEGIQKLHQNFFGELGRRKVFLYPEEALFVMNFQKALCYRDGKHVTFNDVASFYSKDDKRLFIKYNAFRDWRDRGLVAKRIGKQEKGKVRDAKRYPTKPIKKKKLKITAYWHPESMFSVVEDEKTGPELFGEHWFGQYGVYRQDRGSLLKLDFFETVFLARFFGLKVVDAETGRKTSHSKILDEVVKKREYARQLYDVYEEWRLNGYIVKTGFKFGSHFRIYFPGASPSKGKGADPEKWIHSKHVLHVFPKEQKLLVSEWARAVRVAHSVKKTFLLSIPKLDKKDYVDYPSDFVAWRRKKDGKNWIRETPEDRPRYLLVPVSEDEHIGGIELASLLKKAKEMGLSVLLSITDRETAITYYVLNRINISDSGNEYYEIEWMKP
jgi:tRNA-intron endonuclease